MADVKYPLKGMPRWPGLGSVFGSRTGKLPAQPLYTDLESVRSIAERTGIAQEIAGPSLILGHAYLLAATVHAFQFDKCGVPYLHHVVRVADAMDNDTERAVAILHDVLEDCGSAKRANKLYFQILTMYGQIVAMAVRTLTKNPDEDYAEYIARVAKNPLATKVKLADLTENLRAERLVKLPLEDQNRLRHKYTMAKRDLEGMG